MHPHFPAFLFYADAFRGKGIRVKKKNKKNNYYIICLYALGRSGMIVLPRHRQKTQTTESFPVFLARGSEICSL